MFHHKRSFSKLRAIDGENFACHDEKSVTISHSPAAPRAAAAAAAAITSGSNGIL